MACISIGTAPTREVYEQVSSQLRLNEAPPAGLIVQTAAESEVGVKIVSVWDSHEAMTTFERERLLPVLGEARAAESRPEVLEAFEVFRGR